MAVKYVKDFEFPSSFGFQKAPSTNKGQPKGMGSFTTAAKAGPSVVTGNTRGTGGGKHTSGSVPKFKHGGHATTPQPYAKGGLAKGSGIGEGGNENKGIGSGTKDEHYAKLSDKKSPAKTTSEKSSGVTKPAFKKGGKVSTPFAYKKGGQVKPSTPQPYAKGGKAAAPVDVVNSGANNPNDAVSPGSFKRTPPGEKVSNKSAANSKFDGEGRNTAPATKQSGNVERMSGFSDFKDGGRVGNLGKYAHAKKGGSVKATRGEVKSGSASGGKVVNSSETGSASEYEHDAGTPGVSFEGDAHEIESGEAYSMGGMSRGASPKRNAAIHAKNHKPSAGALAAVAAALGAGPPHQPQAPGIGPTPPGMGPGMGAPPGGPMGPRPMPPMAGGPPMAPGGGMAHGGPVMHVVHHHIQH